MRTGRMSDTRRIRPSSWIPSGFLLLMSWYASSHITSLCVTPKKAPSFRNLIYYSIDSSIGEVFFLNEPQSGRTHVTVYPRHSQYNRMHAPRTFYCHESPLRGFPLLRSSLLLIERRSLRSFPCTDPHASMESVLRKLRVNCWKNKNKKFKKVVDILELFLYNESCVTDKAF